MQATTILLEIAARASTLRERIEGRYVHAESVAESEIARQRLTVWKDAVARGENTVFLRRLDWDELGSVESLPLGKPSIINTEQLPDWVSTVGEILELAPRVFELDVDGTATKDKRLSKDDNEFLFLKGQKFPFQELVSPAVLVATDRLKERLGDDLKECLPEALAGMQQSLLYELTEFGKQVFQRKFTLGRLLGKSSEPGGPSSYVLYLDRMLNQKGLETTFREYPVLARMMACAVDAWVEDTHCFLERLTRDLQELERVFCESTPLGSLVHVDDALSDAHHGRRFVKRLTFSGGNSIIYKPRDVGLLAALQEFVKQLQSLDQNIDLKALQVLDKKSYGWVESVSHEPCEDESGGARFFERSGSLLAVFYLLQGTDCHKENLIAVGEHPVIIDAETLINPSSEIKSEEDAPELNLVGRRASDDSSVLTTGMLPRWDAIGPSTDVSALGAVVEQVLAESTVRWVDVNTDKMRRVEEPSISQPLANNAYFKDTTFIPNDYVDQIVTGFRRVCTAVNENATTHYRTNP